MRTKQIGHVTLHEGKDGRWAGLSFPPPDDLIRFYNGQIDHDEYRRAVLQRSLDHDRAHALLGKKATDE